ncbi:MAG: exonuclease SbcCD subunit D [Gemmataceae bacterium]
MRILHTGDWHLGDRVGSRGVDRTADIRKNVERIAGYCEEEAADVLLVAGDLFSDKLGLQKDLSETIDHLGRTFRRFLQRGGTILAVTGNHDREIPCQTLKNTLALADPREYPAGGQISPGRFYLATGASFFRLAGRDAEVQFLMMPYPMPARYFDGSGQGGTTREEVNRKLQAAYSAKLQAMMTHAAYRGDVPAVLVAHVHVRGANPHQTFRISEEQDVVFNDGDIPAGFAYVALGHIHKAQALGGLDHVRYCGSVQRLSMDEREYSPGVPLVEIGPARRVGDVRLLPLEATPFYDIVIDDPAEISRLAARYPDAAEALVKYRLAWKPGAHNREELVRQIEVIFPRWYDRDVHEIGKDVEATRHESLPAQPLDPAQTVMYFLEHCQELENASDRDELLKLAGEELAKMPA